MSIQTVASGFLDFETLGKWDASVVMSAGLTVLKDRVQLPVDSNQAYDVLLGLSTEFKFDIKDQVARGRIVESSVMKWWAGQGDEAKRVLVPTPEDKKIDELFSSIENFLIGHGLTWRQVRWFDRNSFDMSKAQHIWEVTLGRDPKEIPWNYTQVWEIATFLKFCGLNDNRYGAFPPYDFKHPNFIYHSAKCDTALDALRFYKTFHP